MLTSCLIIISVIYLTCTMALGTASVCLTVLVLNLHHRDAERPLPKWLRTVVLHYLARALYVSARKPRTMAINLQHDSPDGEGIVVVGVRDGLCALAHDGGLMHAVATPNGHVLADRLLATAERIKSDHTHEWKEVAHVLDRLFFWIIFTSMTASAFIIILVPWYKEVLEV